MKSTFITTEINMNVITTQGNVANTLVFLYLVTHEMNMRRNMWYLTAIKCPVPQRFLQKD